MSGRICACLLAALLAAEYAHAATIDSEGYGYLAGGIGADEMQRLAAREHEFNVKLIFTLVEGNYISDVAVVFNDKAGNPVLVLHAPGPLVLARLPRGSYVVEATYEGNTQTRKLDVRERRLTEHLRWPSNPEFDFPGPRDNDPLESSMKP